MLLAQITNGSIRKRVRKLAELQFAMVGIIGGELRPLSVDGFCARNIGF